MKRPELARKLREADVIFHEPVELRGGETSNFYIDIKKAYGNPEILREMACLMLRNFTQDTTCIAASGYGGIPLGVAISLESGLPLVSVRDTEKNHGKRGLFDGYVPSSSDVVSIVDDVFTSGSSLRQTAANLGTTESTVADCHVVAARGDTSRFALPVSYLFNSTGYCWHEYAPPHYRTNVTCRRLRKACKQSFRSAPNVIMNV